MSKKRLNMTKSRLNLRKVAAIAACLAVTMGFASCETEDDDETKVPGAVVNFTASAGNAQVSLTWEAPSDDGGADIIGYEVTRDDWTNKETKTASQLSHTYTGLTNGTEYTFKVRAVNEKGAGAESTEKATPAASSSGGGDDDDDDGNGADIDNYVQKLIDYVGKVTIEGKTVVKYKITSGLHYKVNLIVVDRHQDKPENCDVTMYEGFPDAYWYNYYKNNTNVWSADQLAQMNWVDLHQCYWIFSENENTEQRLNVMTGTEWITVQ
jgi:hypothetical protein